MTSKINISRDSCKILENVCSKKSLAIIYQPNINASNDVGI